MNTTHHWDTSTIALHKEAAQRLEKVKEAALSFIVQNSETNEYQLQQYILEKLEENGLVMDEGPGLEKKPIVAFNASAAQPHYFPEQSCLTLEPESLILLDLWARLAEEPAPYADITWMAYFGNNISQPQKEGVEAVFSARNFALEFIKTQLKLQRFPSGREVDQAANQVLEKAGFQKNILHSTGHALGFESPHGDSAAINAKNDQPLLPLLGYTIEPGIYLPGEWGVRSEIDFYMTEDFQLVITTDLETSLTQLSVPA